MSERKEVKRYNVDMYGDVYDHEEGQFVEFIDYKAVLNRLRLAKASLAEAIEDIDSWAGYASGYFQDKHDLIGTLARHRRVLSAIGDLPAGEEG